MKSIINLLPYIGDSVSWVPRLCWTYEQIGPTNTVSEWNSFVCRGLTVPITSLRELLRISALLQFTELSLQNSAESGYCCKCKVSILRAQMQVVEISKTFRKDTLLSSVLPGIGHCFPLSMLFSDSLFLLLPFFWPCHTACGILVPGPGTEPWLRQ